MGAWRQFQTQKQKSQPEGWLNRLTLLVGAAGFELATPCTPCKCATRLRYAPTGGEFYHSSCRRSAQMRRYSMMLAISARSDIAAAGISAGSS